MPIVKVRCYLTSIMMPIPKIRCRFTSIRMSIVKIRCHLTSIGMPIVKIRRSSYLHGGHPYTDKTVYSYWMDPWAYLDTTIVTPQLEWDENSHIESLQLYTLYWWDAIFTLKHPTLVVYRVSMRSDIAHVISRSFRHTYKRALLGRVS